MIAVWSSVSVVYVGVCVVALDKVFSKHPRTCSTHSRILKTVLSPTHISNPIVSIETIHSHTHAHTHKTALSLAHDSNPMVAATTYTQSLSASHNSNQWSLTQPTQHVRTYTTDCSLPRTRLIHSHTHTHKTILSLAHDSNPMVIATTYTHYTHTHNRFLPHTTRTNGH